MVETFEEKWRRGLRLSQGAGERSRADSLFMTAKKILVPQRNVKGGCYCSFFIPRQNKNVHSGKTGLGGSQVETWIKLVETECDG